MRVVWKIEDIVSSFHAWIVVNLMKLASFLSADKTGSTVDHSISFESMEIFSLSIVVSLQYHD
jgi:hypothetical protein